MPCYKPPRHNKTRMQLAQERADRLGALLWIVFFLLALAITSQWDYEAEREAECWEQSLRYDPSLDVCISQTPQATPEKGTSHAQAETR